MKIRMLIDAEVPDHEIGLIASQIAEQPVTEVNVRLDDSGLIYMYAGRFIGAQQVFGSGS